MYEVVCTSNITTTNTNNNNSPFYFICIFLCLLVLIILTLISAWTMGVGDMIPRKSESGTTRSDIRTSLDNCVMWHLFSEYRWPAVSPGLMFPNKQFKIHKKRYYTSSWCHDGFMDVKDKYDNELSDFKLFPFLLWQEQGKWLWLTFWVHMIPSSVERLSTGIFWPKLA